MGPGVGSTIACKMKKLPPPATRPTNYTVREQKLQILEVINCPLDLPEFTQVMGRLVHVPRPVCNMAAGHIVHLYHRIITWTGEQPIFLNVWLKMSWDVSDRKQKIHRKNKEDEKFTAGKAVNTAEASQPHL